MATQTMITNGPGKWDLLVLGLGEGKELSFNFDDSPHDSSVELRHVKIVEICPENRQEQMWKITCFISSKWTDFSGPEGYHFKALYSTKTRQGEIIDYD